MGGRGGKVGGLCSLVQPCGNTGQGCGVGVMGTCAESSQCQWGRHSHSKGSSGHRIGNSGDRGVAGVCWLEGVGVRGSCVGVACQVSSHPCCHAYPACGFPIRILSVFPIPTPMYIPLTTNSRKSIYTAQAPWMQICVFGNWECKQALSPSHPKTKDKHSEGGRK